MCNTQIPKHFQKKQTGGYLLQGMVYLMPGTYTVRIGIGGVANQRGGDTILWHNEISKTVLRVRGGGSGSAQDGGCGGGAPSTQLESGRADNNGFNGSGYDGGLGCVCPMGAGGGGGAGGPGIDGMGGSGGDGGSGVSVNLMDTGEVGFGGGGGGYGGDSAQSLGMGGMSGFVRLGGNGNGQGAMQNTGSGGGGSLSDSTAGSGSSGVVIFRLA